MQNKEIVLRLFVTGSSGFVGHQLVEQANALGWSVIRHRRRALNDALATDIVCDINKNTDWMSVLGNVDCIVHCAARVHQMKDNEPDSQRAYDTVNIDGTINLARQAVKAGVKRFIFISSIKVNGESTECGRLFTSDVKSEPDDLYGRSKYWAEKELKELSNKTGLELIIIRPPLVYGPSVKANFLSMMHLVKKKIPLPLGALKNRRSFVFIDNLIDLICLCCSHSKAPGHVFLVSDDYDVSIADLLKSIAKAMNTRSYLIPVPEFMLRFVLVMVGKRQVAERICSSLQLDISQTKEVLGWTPPYSFDEGIDKTVKAYLKEYT